MTTERKHDGFAVFDADGEIIQGTNGPTEHHAAYLGGKSFKRRRQPALTSWREMAEEGYTVRPVTITEVKDDE